MESLCVMDDAPSESDFWLRQIQHVGRPKVAVKAIEGSALNLDREDTLDWLPANDPAPDVWCEWSHEFDFADVAHAASEALGAIDIQRFDHTSTSFQLAGSSIADLVRASVVEALDRIWIQEFDREDNAASLEEQLREERALREQAEERLRQLEAASEVETDELGDLVVFGAPLERKPITLRFLGRRQGAPLIAPEDLTD